MKIITPPFRIKPESAILGPAVERLYGDVLGPARFAKASHRFRIGAPPVRDLCWIALEDDRVIGAIRYWPIGIGAENHPALLLGPLAIVPERAGRGVGSALVGKTLAIARWAGHDLVLLVGDRDYYERFGFLPATPYGFVMLAEKRPERLQVLSVAGNPLGRISGEIHAAAGTQNQRSYRSGSFALGR